MKQVVILAGGKGTRLKERLGNLPKPLIDVCGVPLLERQVLLAKKYGFTEILILVNYQAQYIAEFCASRGNWGLNVHCIDDGEPLGTAGAILKIFDHLENEFLVMYGDTMLDVDLRRFYDFHSAHPNVDATLFLHPNDHPHDSDLVEMNDDGLITGFYPYPHDQTRYYPNLVNAALYWIHKSSLNPWRQFSDGIFDFGKQLFPLMIKYGCLLRGYNSPEYIKDCGTPSRIDKVSADFMSGKISRSALSHEQMAVFIDRDGTLNNEVDYLSSPDKFELIPGTEDAIRRLNQSEFKVCVVTNQPVVARGECSKESLRQIHNKFETLLGYQGAFVDRIYYCPHHPEKGFPGEVAELKFDCKCRKPKTGMIDAAINDLNISRQRSWMIGDTTTDLLTARKAGLKSILVETGYGGLDQKYWVSPDYTVPDAASAVSFILDTYPILRQAISPLIETIQAGNLIFIGGQSRSGKSTFSSLMRDALTHRGLQCHILSTDRWLLSESLRGEGVLARHDVASIQNLVAQLVDVTQRPRTLSLPGYKKTGRVQIAHVESLSLKPADIILIEGVVALHFANAISSPYQYFIEIDEPIRKQRILREYLIRGYTTEKAESIYNERFTEEWPWVNATKDKAHVISLTSMIHSYQQKNDHK